MDSTPEYLDFSMRDLYLQKIQEQIMAKRHLLLSKQKMLNKTAKQNHFLTEVQKDYAKYYDFIIKQKKEQIKSMEIIKEYLNDIIVSGKLTNKDIFQAKKQQKDILGEIGTIKNNLNEIMTQTENLQENEEYIR